MAICLATTRRAHPLGQEKAIESPASNSQTSAQWPLGARPIPTSGY
ncbi:MAG: hypothetical protein NZ602_03040 [Thermoguttaceae bacterium]|nr:hypothetical protein [Thermoguttaceae bacterium]MDW8036862.1 hypothetical protein [Thermoguttaceae bacterium]